jgi:uncharacterized repeat protein (TIGR03803 family)
MRRLYAWRIVCALILLPAAPASAQLLDNVLYSFQGGTDGQWPLGKMVFDTAGNLYGVTQAGGSNSCTSYGNCGVVYQLAHPAKFGDPWTETILHVFQGHTTGDASDPLGRCSSEIRAGLVIDASGNLYGATGGGGTGNCEILGTFPGCGTVYEVSPPTEKGEAWTETVLYNFQGGTDGAFPFGDIVFDNAGNLYGATQFGGGYGTLCGNTFYQYCGTVFELSPPKVKGGVWTERILHRFRGLMSGQHYGDGANPNGGLLIDKTGALYGTTQIGGTFCDAGKYGCGTVYRLNPPAKKGQPWTLTFLYIFVGEMDGIQPNGGLIFDAEGNLDGTTLAGGNNEIKVGTVFQLSMQRNGSWTHRLLYSFLNRNDGGEPNSGVALDSTGSLYGTTPLSGSNGGGTFYDLRPTTVTSPAFELLHSFSKSPDGQSPNGQLIFDPIGNIYGETTEGGTGMACERYGCGTVFEVTP